MTMSHATRHSRRSLILGSLGALGALATQAVGRPLGASAANNDPVKVGATVDGTSTTKITNSTDTSTVFWAQSSHGGIGLRGSSDTNDAGVFTSVSGDGVRASSHTGSGGDLHSTSG